MADSCSAVPRRGLAHRRHIRAGCVLALLAVVVTGCRDDTDTIRQIQAERQLQMQAGADHDHLGEAFSLLQRIVELNPQKARQQITYHLNQWMKHQDSVAADGIEAPGDNAPALLQTVSGVLPADSIVPRVERTTFVNSDIDHLRDAYLFRQIVQWADAETSDDPVLADWLDSLASEIGQREADQLRTASRLFDWTVRNVALELSEPVDPAPPGPALPLGMQFRGEGYRQTDYLTVWRGTGDRLQRAGVFTQLCRQTGLLAAVLATQSTDSGELAPWCVGVLVGDQVYLFEPRLGIFIPGPDGVGIATLQQARRDASVMRRLNVPGFFDYPLATEDVQQNIALLNVSPEAISLRMLRLQQALTGDRRMTLYRDADQAAQQLDEQSGIAGVRLWTVPLLAEVYQVEMERAAAQDPLFAFWYLSRWAIMDSEMKMARELSQGRWRHLHGQFSDDTQENEPGARTLYLQQRAPEFEIADLRIDVELQKSYGIRRELGTDPEVYDRQLQQVQAMMRLGKQTATYWLSLVQYDDGRYDTAENWFAKRVLDGEQVSRWIHSARYNLGRTAEQLGEFERAIELYKTDDHPQEHGNRIRARLIDDLASSRPTQARRASE